MDVDVHEIVQELDPEHDLGKQTTPRWRLTSSNTLHTAHIYLHCVFRVSSSLPPFISFLCLLSLPALSVTSCLNHLSIPDESQFSLYAQIMLQPSQLQNLPSNQPVCFVRPVPLQLRQSFPTQEQNLLKCICNLHQPSFCSTDLLVFLITHAFVEGDSDGMKFLLSPIIVPTWSFFPCFLRQIICFFIPLSVDVMKQVQMIIYKSSVRLISLVSPSLPAPASICVSLPSSIPFFRCFFNCFFFLRSPQLSSQLLPSFVGFPQSLLSTLSFHQYPSTEYLCRINSGKKKVAA